MIRRTKEQTVFDNIRASILYSLSTLVLRLVKFSYHRPTMKIWNSRIFLELLTAKQAISTMKMRCGYSNQLICLDCWYTSSTRRLCLLFVVSLCGVHRCHCIWLNNFSYALAAFFGIFFLSFYKRVTGMRHDTNVMQFVFRVIALFIVIVAMFFVSHICWSSDAVSMNLEWLHRGKLN